MVIESVGTFGPAAVVTREAFVKAASQSVNRSATRVGFVAL
jgi:hypothetical protein